ncbi:MAG: hypothetical protein IID33_13585 [Planctomycetes bacterium]|nr:hypothetical protein [Planctomycetota bacterium]
MQLTAPRLTIVCVIFSMLVSTASAQKTAQDSEIDKALRGRQYSRAIELIDAALPAVEQAEREYLMFRRGLAQLYDGGHEAAIEQFSAQLAAFPDGEWSHKARFRTADARVALKQFEAAEKIYAERVRELIGDARKARHAQVYLEFAREFFKPSDQYTKPNYQKALTFYERALELEPGEALRDDILVKRAQCNQKLQKWADAATQY